MTDEPAVEHERLAALVRRARELPTPAVRVTLDDVRAQIRRRSTRQRWLIGGLTAAAAAGVVAVIVAPRGRTPPSDQDTTAVVVDGKRGDDPPLPSPSATPKAGSAARPDEALPADERVRLDEAVTIEVRSGPAPIVVSRWRVEVAAGHYIVRTDPSASGVLHIVHEGRVLAVEPGTTLRMRAGDEDPLAVDTGSAYWLPPTDALLRGAAAPATAPGAKTTPSAAELSERAEAAILGGDRPVAIAALRALARAHPRAPETRAGLVDLARLLAESADPDGARCAYRLVLSRWPDTTMRADIERALTRLGDGPPCRGLQPR